MLPKKGRKLHSWNGLARSAKDYAELVADALRQEHGSTHRTVKTIMGWTGASERSAKNWLAGEFGPSGYFLMRLCVKSPAVRGLVVELLAECDARMPSPSSGPSESLSGAGEQSAAPGSVRANGDIYSDIYGDIDVTIKSPAPAPVNRRQEWFLGRVALGERCTAEDIANHWQVALRTAKRDIALLRDNGRVRFEGSQRFGRYVVLD